MRPDLLRRLALLEQAAAAKAKEPPSLMLSPWQHVLSREEDALLRRLADRVSWEDVLEPGRWGDYCTNAHELAMLRAILGKAGTVGDGGEEADMARLRLYVAELGL